MNNHLPLISIVTVVYNGKDYLEETIKSVISQDYPNIEYIVVDGGSNDGTVEILKNFDQQITRWISEPDRGIYHAMNKGLSLATGEWINFLNGGDRFHDNQTISRLFTLTEHNKRDFLYGDSIIYSSKRKIFVEARCISRDSLRGGMEACHQAMFVRTSISPSYNLSYKYKAEYNWVLDIFDTIDQDRAEHVSQPIVYYAVGGFSEKGLLKNLAEFVNITYSRFGTLQVVKNLPKYTLIFLRYIKYKISGYDR